MTTNEYLVKLLRNAHKLIHEADTSDIDTYYRTVQEAQCFVAEALDLADSII